MIAKGPWTLDDLGRIVSVHSKHADLDFIADIQVAPNGPRHAAALCAVPQMLEALRAVKNDPVRKRLSKATQELLDEALAAAE